MADRIDSGAVTALHPGSGAMEEQARQLTQLAARDRLRRLAPRTGIDFASNDYLGLASDPALAEGVRAAIDRGVPVGSGGSRLLRGNHPEHEALETEAARFFGSEAALFFASGYAANSALFATLPQRQDLIVHDALIHASAHEGMRLGFARTARAAHNDADAFEAAIRDWRTQGGKGRVWIAVESLYSMDGDIAPLDDLIAIADRHDAMLVIDEAHATGVFGRRGEGLSAHLSARDNVISLRTCGKALGCEGALICGPAVMRDYLINRGRGFIFSTAPSPLMAAAVRVALRLVAEGDGRRRQLERLWRHAGDSFAQRLGTASATSQIIPVAIGDDGRAMAVAARVQAAGFDVRGIRPPTVPEGTARLRVPITLNVGPDDVDALADAIALALRAA